MQNLTRELIEREYVCNLLNTKEISKLCGVSQKKVWYFMVKNNIPRRSKKEVSVNDLTGKTFGKLIVLNRDPSAEKNKGSMWKCRCDCGKTKVVRGTSLTQGHVNSCGCMWKRTAYQDISGYFLCKIKNNASRRGLIFLVTPDYLWELYLKQNKRCLLTGIVLSMGRGARSIGQTASLDRIDSSKGYVDGNVRWVHKDVNRMKWDMSDKIFFDWVKKISEHNNLL